MQQVLCPQCGAPVKFTSAASVMAVCGACRSTLLKDAESVRRIGEAAEVLEDYSPLCLGAAGAFDGKRFDVIGRIQLRFDEGFWNEWYLWFEDGSDGWLSDASGQYAVTRRRKVKTTQGMPAFEDIAPGDELKLDGQRFVASDVRACQAGGAQGELPFVPGDGWQARVADYRSLDAFLTLDFSDGPQPELYIGKAFDLSAMQAGSLRTPEQVEETAGRFRGQIKALDCPNCGAPISFVAAMATHVVCPSCASAVDCSGPTAEVIEKARKVQKIRTTLALGAVAKMEGVSYTLIGLMKCADPDPEEPSSWIEYLLFNPVKGFVWLVETDEGWERVQVCDTWPSHNNATSVRWRNRLYQKLYDYTSRVDVALGAFNWRVKAGDSTRITDYKVGTLKLTRELGETELGWSAAVPVSPTQLAQWFDRPELSKQRAMPAGDKPGGYRKWAKAALIALVFLNFDNIFEGRFIPAVIGMAFLWLPALLADKLSGEDE
ncbi:DUF4178 domain-containing protein [Achromobacter arsenitoxydans]|uniref:DUF4178 domain-containing protein n=1 Tax=Achromobacter arsenitoxydans SY8 TaxID=477184 RepID=H0FEX5_9BURK|nr:DUF4178 domain-containing protein [Achromobacter arsenitoxydans]EHK63083.1 hypothetical protein KYC_26697 [Achromobacter arsenitoxydans SY8]